MKARNMPILVFLLLFAALAAPSQSKATAVVSDEQTLQAALQRLKKFKVPDNEKAVFVPELVRQDIARAKVSLFHIIVNTLNAQELNLPDKQLTVFVVGSLKVKGITILKKVEECEGSYGCILNVELKHPAERADILFLTTSFQVPFGDDGSLYVLEHISGKWLPALVYESKDYKQINGAHMGLRSAFFSSGADQSWSIALIHDNPWPTSVWQRLTMTVLSKGSTPNTPKLEYIVSDNINVGEDSSIRADKTGFIIRYITDSLVDQDTNARINIMHLQHSAEGWYRTAPYADNAEGLVDEWMRLRWDDAVDLSDRSNLTTLQEWHKKLLPQPKGVQFSLNDSYECGMGSGFWRVAVDVDLDEGIKTALPPTIYFKLLMTKTEQRVLEVSAVAFNECPQTKVARSVMDEVKRGYFVEPELLSSSSAR
jgi:hypothetical protein